MFSAISFCCSSVKLSDEELSENPGVTFSVAFLYGLFSEQSSAIVARNEFAFDVPPDIFFLKYLPQHE